MKIKKIKNKKKATNRNTNKNKHQGILIFVKKKNILHSLFTDSMDMSLSKLQKLVDREAWRSDSPWGHKEPDETE